VKDEDDQVIVSLYEDIVSDTTTPALLTEEAPEVKPDLANENDNDNDNDSKKSILTDKKEVIKKNNNKSKTKK
jgi:hypothetical protein